VPTWAAFIVGLLAGSVCYGAVMLRDRLKWDDALDVWAAHGVGGLMGTILLGFFAFLSVNAAGANGLFAGNPSFLGIQVGAAALVSAYAFAMTWLILKILNRFEPVRVPDEIESEGLDTEMHEQEAYLLT
jgi:Amt family ammonium transporter